MRKIIILIIAMLALGACVAELPPVDADSLTLPTYRSAPPGPERQAPEIDLGAVSRGVYLDTLGDEYPWLTEAEMLDYAGLACAELNAGDDPLTAASDITGARTQLDNMTAAAVVGTVIGSAYCEHWT